MKLNIELKKGNVIKYNGVPTYIVDCICEYPIDSSWNKMYLGITKDNKVVSIEECELLEEGLTAMKTSVVCKNIADVQNVLKGFEKIPFSHRLE